MRKLILIAIGLFFGVALLHADMNQYIYGTFGTGAGGGGGTTCTGTIGQTGGGTANTGGAGFTWIYRVDFGCTADAGDTTFYYRGWEIQYDTREVVLLIYADNGSGTDPGALVWQSSSQYWSNTSPDPAWNSVVVNKSLSGTYLWIGFHYESASSAYYWTSVSGALSRSIVNAGTFPDVDANWDTEHDTDTGAYQPSCYLSY